jgi:hypothetical protein
MISGREYANFYESLAASQPRTIRKPMVVPSDQTKTIEAYLRNFVNLAQDNWASLTPMAMLELNGRNTPSTGVSPFFLDHGYELEPLDLPENIPRTNRRNHDRKRQAGAIITKLKGALLDLASAAMAAAHQQQEESTNRRRDAAVHYKVGERTVV